MGNDKFGALLDVLPVGILVMDRQGKLLKANRKGFESFGLEERALGVVLADHVESSTLKRALSVPANGRFELDFTEGERAYHGEVRALPGGSDGTKLLVLRDVTNDSSVAIAKKKIIFQLLHMLRTPLTSVVSVLRMAAKGRLDAGETDPRELLAMGVKESDRLSSLLTRLKDLALIETGIIEDELNLEPVPVREMLAEVADDLRPHLAGRAQTLDEDYPLDPVRALADREALPRVLSMVLDNAHRYTPAGGTITLSVSTTDDHTVVKITDNGPGIPPEELSRVFERFSRGKGEHVRAIHGEGLGLYLARHLLLAQNATIVLDSEPDRGTTVEITLCRREDA